MQLAADLATGLVALVHVYILVLEMFLWSRATRIFQIPRDQRDNVMMRTMLKNQGLYNGFLVAGLIFGLAHPDAAFSFQLKLFFLGCVAVAGLYGAVTANLRILFVQTLPASIAIALVMLAG